LLIGKAKIKEKIPLLFLEEYLVSPDFVDSAVEC